MKIKFLTTLLRMSLSLSMLTFVTGCYSPISDSQNKEEHIHTYSSWSVTKEPTLTSTGTLSKNCEANDSTETFTLPTLNENDYVKIVEKDREICTDAEESTYTYTKDGQTFAFEWTESGYASHELGSWSVKTEPTLKTEGTIERGCSRDSFLETFILPAFNDVDYTVTVVKARQYCTDSEITQYVYTIDEQELKFQLGTNGRSAHEFSSWSLTKSPTVTETGLLTRKCMLDTYEETFSLPSFNDTDYQYTEKETATCTTSGKSQYVYTKDGQDFIFGDTIAALGHDIQESICSRCGYIPETSGLVFTLSEDGTSYSLTSVGDDVKAMTFISIPDTYQGLPVTSIGASVFSGCKTMVSIKIPKSITSIANCFYIFNGKITNVYYEGSLSDWCNVSLTDSYAAPLYSASHFFLKDGTVWKEVTDINIPDTVTSIGAYQFYGFDNVTSITIPDSVISIGKSAFSQCFAMTNATLGTGVTSIGANAFESCRSLKSLTMSKSVKTVGTSAFSSCTIENVYYDGTADELVSISYGDKGCPVDEDGSTSVYLKNATSEQYDKFDNYYFDGTLVEWCQKNFSTKYSNPMYYASHFFINNKEVTELVLPESIYKINQYQFYGFEYLTSVTANEQVDAAMYSFARCSRLTDFYIGALSSFGQFAFYGCEKLTNVYCEYFEDWFYNTYDYNNVYATPMYYASHFFSKEGESTYSEITAVNISSSMKIGGLALYGFRNITSVTISDGVSNYSTSAAIGAYAFRDCVKVKEINLPSTMTGAIGTEAFAGCTSLESVSLPEGITSLGNYMFKACTSLKSLTIPSKVTKLGDYVFQGCRVLENISLPDSVTKVGNNIFSDCVGMNCIVIGNGLTILASLMFYNCTSLKKIVIGSAVKNIKDNAFSGCSSLNEFYYYGTSENYAKVTIGASTKKAINAGTVYYYSEMKPTETGNHWHYVDGEIVKW